MNAAVAVRAPAPADMPGVLTALASYRFHALGSAALADPDFAPDAKLTLRNQVVDVDLETSALVALLGGEVAGFCCWGWLDADARIAKTVLIAVTPAARGRGVGAALQASRQDAMWRQGAVAIHTWSDDPKAVAWYKAHFGYREVGTEPICHSLHRFHLSGKSWWGLHRGFPERDTLTHLLLERPASMAAS